MEKNKSRNKWTQENIKYLRAAYLEGLPLKIIARKLGRTVSAINKILERYQLRTHSRAERLPALPRPTIQHAKKTQKREDQAQKINPDKRKPLCPDPQQWVLFDCVLRWLRTQKISVIKSNSDIYYEFNGLPKTEQQILFAANLLREKQHLPVFFVKGVTRP